MFTRLFLAGRHVWAWHETRGSCQTRLLLCCYIELELVRLLTQQWSRSRVPVACRGSPWGPPAWHILDNTCRVEAAMWLPNLKPCYIWSYLLHLYYDYQASLRFAALDNYAQSITGPLYHPAITNMLGVPFLTNASGVCKLDCGVASAGTPSCFSSVYSHLLLVRIFTEMTHYCFRCCKRYQCTWHGPNLS